MSIHHITEENQMLFYCKDCNEKRDDKSTTRSLIEGVEYSIAKCGCGNECRVRENFNKQTHADGTFFINLELLL